MNRGIKSGIAKIENSTDALPLQSMRILFAFTAMFLIPHRKNLNLIFDSQLQLNRSL